MVDILQAEGISRYYHAAWADDADGTNFSLTEYDGAQMIGTYNDDSGTESIDPTDYNWQIIGAAESGDGDPATAAAENEINALTAAVDDLTAKTITNAGNIDRANASSVEGIGQPNLLSGTNRGADGWTGSGFTLAAETGTVYNETDTPITWLKATCVTPGALSFTADGFRAILAEDSDTDTYTLSFDMRQSVLFDVNVSMADADGTNIQIDFGTADSESDILEDLRDMAGTWTHQALTAQIVEGNTESAQVLLFDCSAMTAGDTIEIANLKVEGGATDTPWKASAEEAMNAAEAAQATADIKKRVFTAQPVPPYNVGDLWVDLGSADYDLVTSAGDVLVDDQANALIASVLGTGSETVVYVSTFARTAEEAYTESDWTLAATDDAKVDELREWFWHDSLGAHVLGDATGYRNDITSTGMQIIDTSTETSVATFGASGVQIGRNGEMHFEQTSTEMQFIDAQDIIRSKITADSTNGICIEDATYQFYIKSSSSGIELVDDQNNGLKVDSGGVYINSVKVEDFVTDEGTSGSWRYRKWNSGKIEAWFEGSFNCAASTTARGALYYSNWSLTIPSAIGFTSAPNTLIGNTGDSETVIAVNGAATSATAMSGKVWRYASSSSALSITARIYAWQN